jgi:hypothetical protein
LQFLTRLGRGALGFLVPDRHASYLPRFDAKSVLRPAFPMGSEGV